MHAFIQLLYLQSKCIAFQYHSSLLSAAVLGPDGMYEQPPKLSARPSGVFSLLSNKINLSFDQSIT